MRDKLSDIAAFLGFANCEIFPKQEEVVSNSEVLNDTEHRAI